MTSQAKISFLTPLRGAEEFLLGILKISHFKQKAECVTNVETFPKLYSELKESMDQLTVTCDKILNSGAMQVVFFML